MTRKENNLAKTGFCKLQHLKPIIQLYILVIVIVFVWFSCPIGLTQLTPAKLALFLFCLFFCIFLGRDASVGLFTFRAGLGLLFLIDFTDF